METNLLPNSISFFGNDLDFSSLGILILLQELLQGTNGLFPSNISMNGVSAPWYMPLTQFETVFLCLIMFQICVLRYIEILPININNWFHGDPSGRKKRSVESYSQGAEKCTRTKLDTTSDSMIGLLTKIDEEECFLRSLCLIATEGRNKDSLLKTPSDIRKMIQVIKRLTEISEYSNTNCLEGTNNLSQFMNFKEAVQIDGLRNFTCEERYKRCTLTRKDTIHYLNLIFEHQ